MIVLTTKNHLAEQLESGKFFVQISYCKKFINL